MFPNIMKYLPRLLPELFLDLLERCKNRRKAKKEKSKDLQMQTKVDEDVPEALSPQKCKVHLLAKLEELIKTDVWKLGFNHVSFPQLWYSACNLFYHCTT